MKNKLLLGVLAFALLFMVSCTPGANSGARPFPLKLGEVWQMQAFKPGNTDSQTFPIELYDEPELDSDGNWGVAIEAGKFDGELYYATSDNVLIALVELSRGTDPDILVCIFGRASLGKTEYTGSSFFGKVSELREFSRLPQERFANCNLKKQ